MREAAPDVNHPTARNHFSPRGERGSALTRTVAAAEPAIRLRGPDAPNRDGLEACIAEKFARQYGARIRHFLPYLVDLTITGELGAVAGLRPAREGALFLEQYFDARVEQAVSRVYSTPVDRGQVVEIGNLVSVTPGAASLLFGILPALLAKSGFRWVVCTATPQIRSMLCKLGFKTRVICSADPRVLGDGKHDWGSYYDSRPQVIVGDAREALACTADNQPLRSLVEQQGLLIERLASALRTSAR
jgi:hypothetical protein